MAVLERCGTKIDFDSVAPAETLLPLSIACHCGLHSAWEPYTGVALDSRASRSPWSTVERDDSFAALLRLHSCPLLF